jgi:RHS repeat-associated protein
LRDFPGRALPGSREDSEWRCPVDSMDASGNKVAESRHYPYGVERWSSGTLPTDYRFTGQRFDSYTQLTIMGSRWYDGQIGRWISPDTIIPDPANPQSLNRLSYVYNNPINFVDPSGFDPLDEEWESAFRAAHGGRDPTDADRQARLFSLLFLGPVSGKSAWTEEDWTYFSENRADLFMRDTTNRESLSDFAGEIESLSQWYDPGEEEQFVWAIALLYAGVPYGSRRWEVFRQGFGGPRVEVPECVGQRLQCRWLTHGMRGFSPLVAGQAENTHHYAGQLLAGYYLWEWAANEATFWREFAQGNGYPDQLDINMGEIAVRHGRGLEQGTITPWNLSYYILRDLAPYLPVAPKVR